MTHQEGTTPSKTDLWDSVCVTDPNHTRQVKKGRRSFTAIDAQYQILNATKQFGPYGTAWGLKNITLDYSLADRFNIVVLQGSFIYPGGIFSVINSMKLFINNENTWLDDEFAKKLETDTITKALSRLGFNADVFLGKFNDARYVDEEKRKQQENKERETALTWLAELDNCQDLESLKATAKKAYDLLGHCKYGEDIIAKFNQCSSKWSNANAAL